MAKILVQIDRPYFQCLEPIELAMALAAFDHDVTLILQGQAKDLISGQIPPMPLSNKDLNKLIKSLDLYDIQVMIDDDEVSDLLANHDNATVTRLEFN